MKFAAMSVKPSSKSLKNNSYITFFISVYSFLKLVPFKLVWDQEKSCHVIKKSWFQQVLIVRLNDILHLKLFGAFFVKFMFAIYKTGLLCSTPFFKFTSHNLLVWSVLYCTLLQPRPWPFELFVRGSRKMYSDYTYVQFDVLSLAPSAIFDKIHK